MTNELVKIFCLVLICRNHPVLVILITMMCDNDKVVRFSKKGNDKMNDKNKIKGGYQLAFQKRKSSRQRHGA